MSTKQEDWRLKNISISFKRGYSFDNSKDRYEGDISFENGEGESFCFKVRENMAADYIALISEDIVKAADNLGQRLIESLGLVKNNNHE